MGIRDVFTALIRADVKGAVSELRSLSTVADGAADKVQRGFKSISGSVESAVGSIITGSPLAQSALRKTGIDGQAAASAIGTALPGAAAAGAAALGAFAAKAVASTMQLDAGILAVQRATGATAEQASALVAIGDDFGLGAEQISDSLAKLAKNADSKVLGDFGVALARTKDGSADLYATLANVAEAFSRIDDPTERARLANAAFGKSWQQMIPILEQGRKGLANAYSEIGDGQIRTQEQIDASEELRLTFDALSDAAGGLSLTVGSALIPVIQQLADAALTAKEGADVLFGALDNPVFDALGLSADSLATKFGILANPVGTVSGLFDDLFGSTEDADKAAEAYGGTIRAVTESTIKNATALSDSTRATKDQQKADADAAKAAADHAKAVDELRRKTDERAQAALDAAGSIDAVERAEGRLGDAVEALNDARRKQVEAEPGNREADRRVELGIYGVRDAFVAAAGAAVTQAEKIAGGKLPVEQARDVQLAALEAIKGKFKDLAPEIDAYVARLKGIPTDITTNLFLRGGAQIPTQVATNIGGQLPMGVNVNINLPPGTDGEDVVSAMTRWRLRNGGL